MARNIVIQFDDDVDIPAIISVDNYSQQTVKILLESLLSRGMVGVPAPIGTAYTHIDSFNTQTLTVAYTSDVPMHPPGTLVVVNPQERPILDALLEVAAVPPRNNDIQTLRLTTGEGVQDPAVGRVFDIYFKALQQQDYDKLYQVFHSDISLHSVVDQLGNEVDIHGAENVIKNIGVRWNHFTETYGPIAHRFLLTQITRNNALFAFELPNTGLTFYSMYTVDNQKISSIRHMKEAPRDWRVPLPTETEGKEKEGQR